MRQNISHIFKGAVWKTAKNALCMETNTITDLFEVKDVSI